MPTRKSINFNNIKYVFLVQTKCLKKNPMYKRLKDK